MLASLLFLNILNVPAITNRTILNATATPTAMNAICSPYSTIMLGFNGLSRGVFPVTPLAKALVERLALAPNIDSDTLIIFFACFIFFSFCMPVVDIISSFIF